MKGIYWNCNGFADQKKYRFLSELVKEKNLDFMALSETGRTSIPQNTLNNICAGKDYLWHTKAPVGRSGGMLVGVNLTTFDIGEIEEGEFFVHFKLRNREDNFIWNLVSVYGPAQPDLKEKFLTELVQLCTKETIPIAIGGDFNIIWGPQDKNNDNYNIDGLFFLMPSLMLLISESSSFREGNILGQIIYRIKLLRNSTEFWSVRILSPSFHIPQYML